MKLVALDYGGVVGDHHIPEAERRLAALFRVDVLTLCAMLSERSELGSLVRRGDLTMQDFWLAQAESCGLETIPAPMETLSRLWAETYRLNPQFQQGLESLRGRVRTGIVTNIDEGRAAYLVHSVRILDIVDYLWASHELQHTKAEPEMWSSIASDAKKQGVSEMLYIDDRPHHVAAARAAGFVGLVHEGDVMATLDAINRWVVAN